MTVSHRSNESLSGGIVSLNEQMMCPNDQDEEMGVSRNFKCFRFRIRNVPQNVMSAFFNHVFVFM
jgi:hypothetical protein